MIIKKIIIIIKISSLTDCHFECCAGASRVRPWMMDLDGMNGGIRGQCKWGGIGGARAATSH